jgi:hypothetical protein
MLRITIGSRVQMRKQHPCGSNEWLVERVGVDIGLRCDGCGRHVLLPREGFYKQLKKIISAPNQAGEEGKPLW